MSIYTATSHVLKIVLKYNIVPCRQAKKRWEIVNLHKNIRVNSSVIVNNISQITDFILRISWDARNHRIQQILRSQETQTSLRFPEFRQNFPNSEISRYQGIVIKTPPPLRFKNFGQIADLLFFARFGNFFRVHLFLAKFGQNFRGQLFFSKILIPFCSFTL